MRDTWTGRDLGEPSAEQIAALEAYAATHGRTWKAALLDDWTHARQPGLLQQVRNQFGPRWLMLWTLPSKRKDNT